MNREYPAYLDPEPDCECGHEWEDHIEIPEDSDIEYEWVCNAEEACDCHEYRPKDDYYYAMQAEDARAERAGW